jgi:hypothetical protein
MRQRAMPMPTATPDQERLKTLHARAVKLGYQVEASVNRSGYCLWRVLPDVGRYLILGREGGVPLEGIERKLDEIEGDVGTKG